MNQAGKVLNYEELSGKADSLANTWIIDSGATDHIVCNIQLLTSLRPATHHDVKLPSDSSARVTHIGTVQFTSQFRLENVLCVPSFYLNLISVSKLVRDSFYVTIFLRQVCFVQDLRSGKMIGTGTEKEGLYCLDIYQEATCSMARTQTSNLWHERLGHPSNRVFSLFPFSKSNCAPNNCLICPLAKQTRQPFPLSTTSSKDCFELIHVDICGGYHVPSLSGAQYFFNNC